jgi:dihydrofolate reductase
MEAAIMSRIIESTLVSVDGIIGDPHLWTMNYFDREAEAYALELLANADAMLMGRKAYEFFAAAFPHRTGPYGDRVNQMRKYVFSSTLKKADWNNSVLVRGNPAAEAAKLKQEAGKDLVIYGHTQLAHALLQQRLLDELKLWIHPLCVGRGQPFFREGEKTELKLINSKTLPKGVVVLTYQRL